MEKLVERTSRGYLACPPAWRSTIATLSSQLLNGWSYNFPSHDLWLLFFLLLSEKSLGLSVFHWSFLQIVVSSLSLSYLFTQLNKPDPLHHPSQATWLRSLHWTFTSSSMSLLNWGAQNWMRYLRCTPQHHIPSTTGEPNLPSCCFTHTPASGLLLLSIFPVWPL